MRITVAVAVAALVLVAPAFAQTNQLTAATNKDTYIEGETIVVSGSVGTRFGNDVHVVIRILEGDNLKDTRQVEVAQDNNFAATFVAEGPKWVSAGEYTVAVAYGDEYKTRITFDFVKEGAAGSEEGTYEVDAGSLGTFDVPYSITGGSIRSMEIVPDDLAIMVGIDAADTGRITLELPREFIGAESQDSKDIPFIVLIDNIETGAAEAPVHADHRTLSIDFIEGDSEISIIGTYAIPEFGAAVMAVAIAGTAAAIAASRRLKTGILP